MKVSTQNQLKGVIIDIKEDSVSVEVSVKLPCDDIIVAVVATESMKNMGLKIGDTASTHIKATDVILGTGALEVSARNLLSGEIETIKEGVVSSEILLDLGDYCYLSSIITTASVERLNLEPGKSVFAIIKASNVVLSNRN
jgi:molybdate transport system regulatory protein